MIAATLGNFNFVVWNGPPYDLPMAHLYTETRPGVRGFNCWNVGEWGDPFQVNTIAVAATHNDAIDIKVLFDGALALGALTLTYRSVPIVDYLFKVLNGSKHSAGTSAHAHCAGNGTQYKGLVDSKWVLAAMINPDP